MTHTTTDPTAQREADETMAEQAVRRVADHAGVSLDCAEVAYRTEIGNPSAPFEWEVRCVVTIPPKGRKRNASRHTATGYGPTISAAADMCCGEIDKWKLYIEKG